MMIDLSRYRSIAIIGVSRDASKPSRKVMEYLASKGFRIYPVNPYARQISGIKCYRSLSEIPDKVDIVDIFRPAEEVPGIVEQAIEKKARLVWMQEGIVSRPAAEKAARAGLEVVMDKCLMKEHKRGIKF